MRKVYAMYSLVDQAAKVWNAPMTFQNEAQAFRMLNDLVNNNKESMPHKFPADYSLRFVGFYDEENGEVVHVTEVVDNPGHPLYVVLPEQRKIEALAVKKVETEKDVD